MLNWKLALALGCALASAVSAGTDPERARASSYIFRSFDATPSHVVYLSPARSRLVYGGKHEPIRVKANVESESSEEDGSDEHDEPKVLQVKHSEESGESYEDQRHSKKGEHDRKGYNRKHALKKGSKGSYGKEDQSHTYANEGDRKKSYHDEDSYHKDHHDEGHQVRGGKHGEKKSHKKGSKTTGYHNVYHKDEFKKEHIFYDTADHTGNFKKYGSSHKEHAEDAGQFSKGGHKEEGHSEKKHSKKGHSEDGKYDSDHHEYKKQRGDSKQYRDREEFSLKDGKSGSNVHGYKIYHQ